MGTTFYHHLRLATLGILGLVACLTLPRVHAQEQRCFAETNQCIDGRFRQYWEQNGALAVFGYPISSARDERNRDTGQTYRTQWFERNRFEAHPENASPYDVLLGRLGEDRLIQSGRDWRQEGREAGPQDGCRWFAETGHNVCNQGGSLGFRQYWETHGLNDTRLDTYGRSLALFGLPLTAPRLETNSSGDTVLTQWFERARFEWHPDKPAEFKVLLGRLGDEVLNAGNTIDHPAGRIAYVSSADTTTGGDIYIMNADGTDQTRLTVTSSIPLEGAEFALSPTGDRIAYRSGSELIVQYVDGGKLARSVATQVVRGPQPLELFSPAWAPDGSYVAFLMNGDIYVSRADGSPAQRITQSGDIYAPACITWARNGYLSFRVPALHTFKIMVVRSDGSDQHLVGWGLCGALSPSGDRVAIRNGGDLEIWNFEGTERRTMTAGRNFVRPYWSPDGTQLLAAGINSDNPYDSDIFVVDAATGAVRQLTTDPDLDTMPAWSPDGSYITFASKRTLRYGVYVMRADGTNQHQLATAQESSAPQWAPR